MAILHCYCGDACVCHTEFTVELCEVYPSHNAETLAQVEGIKWDAATGDSERMKPDVIGNLHGGETRHKASCTVHEELSAEEEQQLESAIAELEVLCKNARMPEAYTSLQKLTKSLTPGAQRFLQRRLVASTMLCSLDDRGKRMQDISKRVVAPAVVEHADWISVDMADPNLGTDFKLNVSIRPLTGAEFDVNGPSLQASIRYVVRNLPCSLEQFALVHIEVDLMKKEWVKDCEELKGWTGGEEQYFGPMSQQLLNFKVLPVCLSNTLMRSVAVCDSPPFSWGDVNGFDRGGLWYFECNPPDNTKKYDGWQVAPQLRYNGWKKTFDVAGANNSFYIVPSGPSTIDILVCGRIEIAIPRWILPIDVLKRIAADASIEYYRNLKGKVFDHWDKWDYVSRRDTSQAGAIYEQLRKMTPGGSAGQADVYMSG